MLARILYILLAILCFGVMIAIHEFGHFFTAKLLRVKVNEFSIGMGPLLWTRTRGETKYSFRLFPIGGFCAMEGEDEETGDPRAFSVQARWKKVIILVAGSFMNLLLGLLIVCLLFSDVTHVRTPVITDFMDGFSLEGEQGLMEGDRILSIDGHAILLHSNVTTYLDRNDGNGIDFVVLRNGEKISINDLPLTRQEYDYEGKKVMMFGLIFKEVEEVGGLGRLKLSIAQVADFVRMVWMGLSDLITGRVAVREMSGVIGIVDVVSDVGVASATAADGILNVLYFVSFISVNLAVMNMLPIPAMDGGRVFFIIINGVFYLVTRKNIPAKYEGYVHTVGFVLLILLMILVAFNDVTKIIFA